MVCAICRPAQSHPLAPSSGLQGWPRSGSFSPASSCRLPSYNICLGGQAIGAFLSSLPHRHRGCLASSLRTQLLCHPTHTEVRCEPWTGLDPPTGSTGAWAEQGHSGGVHTMEGEVRQGDWEGQGGDGRGGHHNPRAPVKGAKPLALEKTKCILMISVAHRMPVRSLARDGGAII